MKIQIKLPNINYFVLFMPFFIRAMNTYFRSFQQKNEQFIKYMNCFDHLQKHKRYTEHTTQSLVG